MLQPASLLPCKEHAVDHRQVTQNSNYPEYGSHSVEQSANNQQHDSFWPLEKTDLASRNDVLRPSTCVADHHGSGHNDCGQDHVGWPVDGAIVDEQTHQKGQI